MKTSGIRSIAFAFAAACAAPAFGVETSKPRVVDDSPIPCKTDAECPHLACGPCEGGTPITQSMRNGPECAVNPCLDASAVCNEKHECEIGPRTRKNPKIWRKP